MTEFIKLSAAELAGLVADGTASARDITQAHLDRITSTDERLNAFVTVDAEGALATADAVDARRAAGEQLPPLAGVPIAVKDIVVTNGIETTAASKILRGWIPPYDATIVTKLRAAGLVPLGKTNLDEFAMGSSTENSAFGPSRNPWDLARTPGGSSGGSSAAVAAYQAPLAIGTDTGGSIRQPASLTGIVGHKPTYGGVSRSGLIAYASSLDQAGPFGRTVLDAALLHEVIAGHDPADSTSLDLPVPLVADAARIGAAGDLTGMTIGVVSNLSGEGYEPGVVSAIAATVAQLEQMGAKVVECPCPHFDYALAAYYLIAPSECSSNLARFDAMRYGLRVGDDRQASLEAVMAGTRDAGFGAEVKRRIIIGTYALSAGYYDAYYGQAQKVRTLISRDFITAFSGCDVLVSPTSPIVAFELGPRAEDPMAMYAVDLCTLPASLAGVPAISVPCGLSDGLPVGLQIMAPVLADDRCYRVAAAVEASLNSPVLAAAPQL
ncbi:MAG: Asp-tRNA(Asn)/Glu-tRNA(Gln) amidotransferase GatCAB subunit A [Acidimicrobiales bacterium]|nr:MAG: Asp-tRNA(Asn)/Glu-tRNA(Gln) amidotransferase GatCAB subunit A [Acidimicrobiales bacterium]